MFYRIVYLIIPFLVMSCGKLDFHSPFDFSAHKKTLSDNSSTGSSNDGVVNNGGSGSITSGILKVSTGDDHSCALSVDHKIFCAGDNSDSQSGASLVTSNYSDIIKPLELTSLFPGLTSVDITGGYDSTCAIFSNGTAKCWGNNRDGELGAGHSNDITTPESVQFFDGSSPEKKIKTMKSGEYVTCAVSEADSLYCWGDNDSYVIDGQTQPDPFDPLYTIPLFEKFETPRLMSFYDGSTDAKSVKLFSVGYRKVCVVSKSDDFKCFGRLRDDNNGDIETNIPQLLFGLDGSTPAKKVTNLSVGYGHTCYITADQKTWCWGTNFSGRLGCGIDESTLSFSSTPCQVVKDDDSELLSLSIEAGDYQSCAITTENKVRCWGRGSDGAVGDGNFTDAFKAMSVIKTNGSELNNVSLISSGVESGHVCAINSSGELYCWGDNGDGQLFSGGSYSGTPLKLPISMIDSMAQGYNSENPCLIKKDGSLVCSGLPFSTYDGSSPANQVTSMFQNNPNNCLVMANGALNCWDIWGWTYDTSFFNLSDAEHTVKKVASVNSQVCALTTANSVRCANDYSVAQFNNVIDIASNGKYLCIINAAHAVNCYEQDLSPFFAISHPVINLDGVGADHRAQEITMSDNVGCARTDSNKVACWAFDLGGENLYGQLGNGTIVDNSQAIFTANFTNVINGTTIAAISVQAGEKHVCAQASNSDVYCWGDNRQYAVTGDAVGVSTAIADPTRISSLPTSEQFRLNVLGNNSCVVGDTSGDFYCWGYIRQQGLDSSLDKKAKATLISL